MSSATSRRAMRIALLNAGRDYSTAAVMFHHAVADRFGLSVTDLKTLDILQRRGRLTAGEIAVQTSLATASVTSLIDRLQAKRLVRRVRDANDRRRVMVALTPNLETSIAPLFASLSRRMLARFEKYSAGQIALIEKFLTDGASEMREEAGKLAVPASTFKSSRPARVRRKHSR